ncbi:IS256 family transposase [Bacteroides sp.]|uniref:IS256 family transposase n=1 Tax=Bacteroides sp. TaxID=29523 RepID=UPI0025B82F15|nr:IS256 family transposase [Bacteroides sp.]
MDIPKEFLSKEFLSQFKTDEDVTAFMKELHTRVYEQMLEGEMDNHLGYEKHSNQGDHSGNSRNGSYKKQIQTEMGESVIQVPRDREGEFEPVVVPKHQSRGLSIERLVISLYAKGMSVSDIESEMQEIYGINLSTSAISIITNKVSQASSEWQNRPLESLYMIVWMGVLTDLKARGVEDILITVTDNLNGFTETIKSVFPASTTQICVVHQIRNSCRYVVWKEKKEFTSDLKNIYNAPTKEAAKMELDNFEQKWGAKYPYAIRSWRNNWEELTVFFDFPVEIRKIIYTTNLIENLNGKIRKYTKNKLSFPNDDALKKSVYLAITEIEKKWYQPIWNWALIFNQFITIFENRIQV